MQLTAPISSAAPSIRKHVFMVALFAALTALAAQVEIPMIPVPMTMQTAVVMLAGVLLGGTRGALSQVVYLALGLGLPLYAGGTSGAAVLFGATGGYLVSFPLLAYASARITERMTIETPFILTLSKLFAVSFITLIAGTLWLKVALNLSWETALIQGFVPFLIGDVVKCFIAAAVAKGNKYMSTHKPNLF
jgi:biotin transport system substrate-specific component